MCCVVMMSLTYLVLFLTVRKQHHMHTHTVAMDAMEEE